MAEEATLRTSTNEPNGNQTHGGTENPPQGNDTIHAGHFGIFHDEIEDEMSNMRQGLSVINNAMSTLTDRFGNFQHIVRTVGEKYDDVQHYEEKFHVQETVNKGLLEFMRQDRDAHDKEIADLTKKHEDEKLNLEAQAKAGEKEKQKYKDLKKALLDQQKEDARRMERDFERERTKLENETAEKIANLEKRSVELENTNAQLNAELQQRTVELKREKETRITMQNKAHDDIEKLEAVMAADKAKYRVDRRPLEF